MRVVVVVAVVRVHAGELPGAMVLVVEQAIVVRTGSRPRNQGRLPPHLTTTVCRSLCPLETAAYYSVVGNA